MKELYATLEGRVVVSCASHWGHATSHHPLKKSKGCSELDTQIEYQTEIAQRLLHERCDRLVLIGHSIGAHIALHVASRLDENQVALCALLYPAINHLSKAPAATKIHVLLALRTPIEWAWRMVPELMRTSLVKMFLPREGFSAAACNLISPQVIGSVLDLVTDEFADVKDYDMHLIRKAAQRSCLKLYFAEKDSWVFPHDLPEKLVLHEPRLDITRCVLGTTHAFVLYDWQVMAAEIASWITRHLE